MKNKIHGMTLIELMIVVAILGIITSIALPAYRNYIQTGQANVTRINLSSLQFFLEEYKLDNDTYLAAIYNPSTNKATSELVTKLKWRPDGDDDKFIYTVSACVGGNISNCYKIDVSGFGGKAAATFTKPTPP